MANYRRTLPDLVRKLSSGWCPSHLHWLTPLGLLEVHLDNVQRWEQLQARHARYFLCSRDSPPRGSRERDELPPAHGNKIKLLQVSLVVENALGNHPAEIMPKGAWTVPVVLVPETSENLRLPGNRDSAGGGWRSARVNISSCA